MKFCLVFVVVKTFKQLIKGIAEILRVHAEHLTLIRL